MLTGLYIEQNFGFGGKNRIPKTRIRTFPENKKKQNSIFRKIAMAEPRMQVRHCDKSFSSPAGGMI